MAPSGYASFLAEAGVQLAGFRMLDQPVEYLGEEYEKLIHGLPYETILQKGAIKYMVTGETGKIDLNWNENSTQLLRLFLEFHGLETEQIDIIVDALLDWRDTDDLVRLNGAEMKAYEELVPSYIPRNGNIEDPAEFFLIYGTELLRGKLVAEEVFTVRNPNGNGKIDYNNLTPAMLDFVTDRDESKKEAYREALALSPTGKLNPATARQVFGDERYDLLAPYFNENNPSPGRYYAVIAYGQAYAENAQEEQIPSGPVCRIDAVIGKEARGFRIVSWKEQFI